jgi:hypothetical protein
MADTSSQHTTTEKDIIDLTQKLLNCIDDADWKTYEGLERFHSN